MGNEKWKVESGETSASRRKARCTKLSPFSSFHCPLSRQRGMTLVESLVAAVILGVGVAGLISAAGMSLRNQQRFEQRSVAMALAQQKLAEIELTGADTWTVAGSSQGTEDRAGVSFNWTTKLEQQNLPTLYQVTVKVSWSGPMVSDSVELQTLLNGTGGTTAEAQDRAARQNQGNNASSR